MRPTQASSGRKITHPCWAKPRSCPSGHKYWTNTSQALQGTRIGEFIPSQHICILDDLEASESAGPNQAETGSKPKFDLSQTDLSPEEKQQLQQVLSTFADLFTTSTGSLGRTDAVKHTINTSGPPIRQPVRRLPESVKQVVDGEIQKMLQQGVVRPSSSPWSSPIVLIKKRDGSWRFCIDYRKVNAATRRDAYPLPRIDTTLDSLRGSAYFSTLDLASGYWQVEVDERDKEKTAFSTPKGHFEFNVMPFGLTNAPATFQRLMECILSGLTYSQCLIYLDDIIIFSSTFREHLDRLTAVLQKLQRAGLKLRTEKCRFAQRKVHYLGHVVSAAGVEPDPAKVEAISSYPAPRDVREVRQFLGMANYYRRFVKNFSQIASPLYELTKKTAKGFSWNTDCQDAFDDLKSRLLAPPILAYPDFSKLFLVHTDASASAIGGILSQHNEEGEQVIAYWSRQLSKAERNYSTVEREALAAVAAIKEFYPYLYGFPFKLIVDHNPLTALKELKDVGGRLARWAIFLQQFDFTVEYKPGKDHRNADALSRRHGESDDQVSC